MKANQAELPVRALCETLKVSTSGYYDWQDRPLSKRRQANAVLSESIRRAHRVSDETYGMPRIRAELADMGIVASRKRIARLMRAMRIQGVSRRRAWCVTTQRNQRQRPAPDLVTRVFIAKEINELWVADMTYLPTWEGFLYLAVVTDACSRKVVGWAFGVQMTADLVISALNMALHTRRPESVIHHSDQGRQLGFNQSLQHRKQGGVVWQEQKSGCKSRQGGWRCARRAVLRSISGSRSRHSGNRLRQACKARMQPGSVGFRSH